MQNTSLLHRFETPSLFVLGKRQRIASGHGRGRLIAGWILPVVVFALCSGASPALRAQTFLFDFGGNTMTTSFGESPNDPKNDWNNVVEAVGTSDTGLLTNIVTTYGHASTMSLNMIRSFNGVNTSGTLDSTVYPDNATRDSFYGNTELFNQREDVFPAFKLSGLGADTTYTFTFYASRGGASDNRETEYTLTGAETVVVLLNAANNIDTTAQSAAILPDANGEITIEIAPGSNNNNGSHFTYLGALQVDAVPPQGPLTFAQEPSNVQATELELVSFSADVEGPGPYFVQWFSNSLPILDANRFSYTIQSVSLDMDRSMFSVMVSNLTDSITSREAVLRVVTDTEPPTLVSATSPDGLVIYLEYSEEMDPVTTEDYFLYIILEPEGIAVQSAVLQPDGRTVALTLTSQISGAFTLMVAGGASDISANPIAEGSMISGEVPDLDTQPLLIDFGGSGTTTERGPSPDDPDHYWNNLTDTIGMVDGGELTNLVTTLNAVTQIGVVVIDRFNGANLNGTRNPAPYPPDATGDSLYGNTEEWSGLTDVFPVFKLAGLRVDLEYDLTFYASRAGVGDNRETIYTVTGATMAATTLNPANNVTEQVVMAGVVPDSNGEIQIGLTPSPNNNNGNHFTYLGVLRIDPKKPTARLATPLIANGEILLQWTGEGQLQWAPEITGLWTDILPTPVELYTEPLEVGGKRFYRLAPLP